ncbi:MAG TPA: hypothetical protein VD766_12325 [Solirubrobacterales bacterium]|nr:hypothetical protein [Solirubrobacterales bacterium]
MSDLRETTTRLNAIAAELGDENLSDERAEALAREAADLVGEAANQLDRALRESSDED